MSVPANPNGSLSKEELLLRLEEAEETLRAIQSGEVDALVVSSAQGEQIFTLKDATLPYQILIEQMNEGALTLNLQGMILYCNARFAEMLGMPLQTIMGQSFLHFVILDEQDRAKGFLEQRLVGVSRGELTLRSSQAAVPVGVSIREIWLEGELRLAMVVSDLTERRQAELELERHRQHLEELVSERTAQLEATNAQLLDEIAERRQAREALRKSEQKFSVIFEKSAFAAALSRLPNGVIVNVNEEFERVFGYRKDEMIGRTSLELGIDPDAEGRARLTAELQAQGSVRNQELTLLTKSGVPRLFLLNSDLVEIGGEKYILQTAQDITERKQTEDALQRLTEELRRSNADLEQFAYVASHDLQEPLRMVSSYMDLLSRRYQGKLDSDADEFIAYAVDGTKRMQNLINDLLDYARVGTRATPMILTSCETILAKSLTNLQVAVEQSGAAVTHNPLPTVLCDPTQMVQVFQNLIANSIKFQGQKPPQIHISANRQTGAWMFSVRDNGIGFDPKFAERVFEIFQRLHSKTAYPGTGMGLAICKRIIQRHGGRIWVESTPGEGATFYFTLPIQETA